VELVQFGQTATIRENPSADKTMEKLPGVDNPIYEMQTDIVEVKENIYSTIHENLSATLDSAADSSDL